jgi:hypothetical protein
MASAAGVAMLAQPSEAKIVYTVTHKQIAPNNTITLDLNHDGKPDFSFHDSFTCTSFCEYIIGALTVIPAHSQDEIVGYAGRSQNFASALPAGAVIGPQAKFSPGNKVMARGGYDAGTNTVGYCSGRWKNEPHRYLGLKFSINGKIHYGWARLSETCAKNGENTALLTGYAYETIPNKPIIAGKTKGPDQPRGSLGTLAAGSLVRMEGGTQ